ncbi:hypothetical protein KOR42_41440 [Thalassoglobus neptunius]|uniref:Chromosome partitioning protein ParA n=1 Tax=Thalassoglobus neptunius TaxID=1938619 RepID=A0A5C5W8C7_9PLAN|nr:DUF1365 domain-containing protein [Thalassoglobus neptunius]TWT47146.1 hypothetical protein KOR42_41440 [Thalassoglobus neptunius]
MTADSKPAEGGHSCLYVGEVQHHRLVPFDHQFRYRVFLVFLDLSELDEVFRGRWLWSTSRLAVARFRRDDHLGDSARPLTESVADLVEERIGYRPAGPIRLLTHLRYFGYVVNPVSFYYCYNDSGTQVDAVVAEVNNTPWGERHCYVLDWRGSANRENLHAEVQKEFYVSPFLPMEMQYRWQLTLPKESLAVSIENRHSNERQFSAQLTLARRQITTMNLFGTLLRHPFMTGKVVAAIYWQALKLWWRGVQYFPHPKKSSTL